MTDLTIPDGMQTLAILLMDESGSMQRFGAAPIDAIDRWFAEQRAAPHVATTAAAVMTFADSLRIRIPIAPIRSARRFRGYQPDGRTRLFASARDVFQGLRKEPRLRGTLPGRVVIAVFTDGKDNCSSEHSVQVLRRLSADARADGWTLLTFGFGVDARAIARSMGFPHDDAHAQTLEATAASLHRAVEYSSRVTSRPVSS